MNDYSGSSFALGYLAAGSATELAQDVAMTITRGSRGSSVVSLADYHALAANYAALEDYSARLQSHIAYLEEDRGVLERNVERLQRWNAGLNEKLNQLKSG